MSLTLLVDADEFVHSFSSDASRSAESVFVQVMTFEADRAGRRIVEILEAAPAPDVRLLVDGFIEVVMSDRVYRMRRNRRNTHLQREVAETFRLLESLPGRGVDTRLSNPVGPWLLRLAERDHVKIFSIDRRIAYIGGLNISDHNFAWHDCMLRIEDPEIAAFLSDCFVTSWNRERTGGFYRFDDLDLVFFDGRSNGRLFRMITDLLDAARESIWIESPYVSFPLYDFLRRAVRRGVRVDVVAPGRNNMPLMDRYTKWEAERSGIRLHHLPDDMTHVKSCVIDGHTLLLGSSNLDYMTSTMHREVIAIIRQPELVADFRRRVQQPDTSSALPWQGRSDQLAGWLSAIIVKSAARATVATGRIASRVASFVQPSSAGSR